MLELQQAFGNQEMVRLLRNHQIQAKLAVNQPGDAYEHEADRVAQEVVSSPTPPAVQRKCACGGAAGAGGECEECRKKKEGLVQRKAASDSGPATAPPVVHNVLGSAGQPLDPTTRGFLEPRFGHSFGDVRVHTDEQAAEAAGSVNALAFTVGRDVVFGAGQYAPGTTEGRRLLAHELTHVVQQQGAGASLRRKEGNDGNQKQPGNKSATTKQTPNPATAAPLVPASVIPKGGENVDRVGIVNWDGELQVRLRSSPDTKADNVVTTLAFNTHVQVIKRFAGDWLFVSTQSGDLGYVAARYVWMDLPEPNADLHRVKPGCPGTAIAIAECYYGAYAHHWGQDLRFYVNVLAWANHVSVPDTTDGWRKVQFQAGKLIWIPSHDFARSLQGVVNSGSLSYNVADALGVASFIKRAAELWDDFRTALSLSSKYIRAAITLHVELALIEALLSLVEVLRAAVAILAISTAVGAAIGFAVGAAPGAALGAKAGFEVGMIFLEWLGLAMLVVTIGKALMDIATSFGLFLAMVWNARGDQRTLDQAAQQFAEAIGVLVGNVVEAIALYALSLGLSKGKAWLRASKIGKAMGETRAGEWLTERGRKVNAGENPHERLPPMVGPRRALASYYRGVLLVNERGETRVDFDGVDMGNRRFVEHKSGVGLDKANPATGKPQQTNAKWAEKKITVETKRRIDRLLTETLDTKNSDNGSSTVPSLEEIKGFKHYHFVIDADTPALRAAVFAELAKLKNAYRDWTFSVEFGVKTYIPPVPDLDTKNKSKKD